MLESLECIKKLELCFKNKRMKDQNSEEMNEGNIPALLGSNFKAICLFCFYEILSCKGIYIEMLWSQVFWWMQWTNVLYLWHHGEWRSKYHCYRHYTLSKTQYDWRKIEPVTIKANFIHFWWVEYEFMIKNQFHNWT